MLHLNNSRISYFYDTNEENYLNDERGRGGAKWCKCKVEEARFKESQRWQPSLCGALRMIAVPGLPTDHRDNRCAFWETEVPQIASARISIKNENITYNNSQKKEHN